MALLLDKLIALSTEIQDTIRYVETVICAPSYEQSMLSAYSLRTVGQKIDKIIVDEIFVLQSRNESIQLPPHLRRAVALEKRARDAKRNFNKEMSGYKCDKPLSATQMSLKLYPPSKTRAL